MFALSKLGSKILPGPNTPASEPSPVKKPVILSPDGMNVAASIAGIASAGSPIQLLTEGHFGFAQRYDSNAKI